MASISLSLLIMTSMFIVVVHCDPVDDLSCANYVHGECSMCSFDQYESMDKEWCKKLKVMERVWYMSGDKYKSTNRSHPAQHEKYITSPLSFFSLSEHEKNNNAPFTQYHLSCTTSRMHVHVLRTPTTKLGFSDVRKHFYSFRSYDLPYITNRIRQVVQCKSSWTDHQYFHNHSFFYYDFWHLATVGARPERCFGCPVLATLRVETFKFENEDENENELCVISILALIQTERWKIVTKYFWHG